jgi:hypothetical protein
MYNDDMFYAVKEKKKTLDVRGSMHSGIIRK